MNNAFLKSFTTLQQVYNERAFSSIALNKTLNFCKAQDKALITKIVYGVLDNDIKLDYVISKYVKKMPKGDTLIFLKMGTYCLMELSIPVYAVVNDIAELAKVTEDKRLVGFVNATLKSIAKTVKSFDNYPTDELEKVSVKYSYPLWALKKLVKDYGKDTAIQIVSTVAENRTTARFANGLDIDQIQQLYNLQVEPTPFADAFYIDGNCHRWTPTLQYKVCPVWQLLTFAQMVQVATFWTVAPPLVAKRCMSSNYAQTLPLPLVTSTSTAYNSSMPTQAVWVYKFKRARRT